MPLILRLLQYRDPITGLSTLREKEIIAEAVGHTCVHRARGPRSGSMTCVTQDCRY